MEAKTGLKLTEDSGDHIFMSRMWILADTIQMKEFWSYELEPMDGKRIPTSEWARSYCDMLDIEDYRRLFGLEQDKSYQVIFTAKLESYYSGYPICEWDEDMDLIEFKAVEVPQEYEKRYLTLDDTDSPFAAG